MPFPGSDPVPLASTLLVVAVVWFCAPLCRPCIALDLPFCPWSLVMPYGAYGQGCGSSSLALTWSSVSRWRRPCRRLCAGFLYARSWARRGLDIPFGRLMPLPWVCFVLMDLWPSCGVFNFACWVPDPRCRRWLLGFVLTTSLWFQRGRFRLRHCLFLCTSQWTV